jgi:hypothetical protein
VPSPPAAIEAEASSQPRQSNPPNCTINNKKRVRQCKR